MGWHFSQGSALRAIAASAGPGAFSTTKNTKGAKAGFVILASFVVNDSTRDVYLTSLSRSASLMLSLVIAAGVIRLSC